MRNLFKSVLLGLLICVLTFSCNTTNKTNQSIQRDTETEYVLGASPKMYYTLDRNLGKTQLDSLINADGLSELDKWIPSVIVYNGKKTIQYLYIKSLEYDNELMYTVTSTECDTIFKCTKRITSEK